MIRLLRWLVVAELNVRRSLFLWALDGNAGITEVRFYADDARGLVAAARARIASVQDAGRVAALQSDHER